MENIALLYDQDYPLLPMYTRLFVKPRLSRFEATPPFKYGLSIEESAIALEDEGNFNRSYNLRYPTSRCSDCKVCYCQLLHCETLVKQCFTFKLRNFSAESLDQSVS
ncbi:MAG: hypothetical protein K0S23_80 [Fluviicola sp.]|nr:hypothetical protein [Fluviicola sp.]